jgi:outer membrane protein OmpA-like peptidoglycan-associated protein
MSICTPLLGAALLIAPPTLASESVEGHLFADSGDPGLPIGAGDLDWDDDGDCFCEIAPCAGSSRSSCGQLEGGDCMDNPNDGRSIDVNPDREESCDDVVDNDCNGLINDGCSDSARYATLQGGSTSCSSSGATPLSLLALLFTLLPILRRRPRSRAPARTRSMPHLIAAALLLLAPVAMAESTEQDHTVDIELFRPHPDAFGYHHTQSAATLGHLQVNTGFWFNYANDPLVLIYDGERVSPSNAPADRDDGDGVVDQRFMGDVNVGIGLSRYFSLTVDVPIILRQDGYTLDSVDNPAIDPDPLILSGVSDVRAMPKLVFVDRDYLPLGLALAVPVTFPTGNGGSFLGEEGFTVQPTVIMEFSDGSIHSRAYHFRTAFNVGYKTRSPARLRDVSMGNEFVFGLGLGIKPVRSMELVADFHGAYGGPKLAQRPAEIHGGMKFFLGRFITFDMGGGVGLVPGIGAPDYRVLGGFSIAPSFDPNARDSDKDGIVDAMDQCPKDPEDLDGFQDEDGCPEWDNDNDGLYDDEDRCPNEPEDDDGHKDHDGCPDPDNDKDGILDVADRCPDEPETLNGYMDEDGCPDNEPIDDSDGDGYRDDVDRCPYDPEDFDGFEDEDGCPELDNDNDGIPDDRDDCPDVREVFNHFEDEDGCPDDTPRVVVTEEAIEINDVIHFEFAKAEIRPESFGLMDEIAQVVIDHPELIKIRIEGHTDAVGDDVSNLKLSQARAESVMAYLVQSSVEPERLDPVGFGEMRPIDTNETDEGRAKNRRVEFIIVKRDRSTKTEP